MPLAHESHSSHQTPDPRSNSAKPQFMYTVDETHSSGTIETQHGPLSL